ncbi:hypothetical protein [Rhodococcus sp. B50]|uniref:hypothetical protein n=1 Tax=Rhodococcus sp. B50 TaxID=2682847 RepID=UPI001BD1C09C|nr:hypothetical protein [Rhodococcus sp. B50]MBS9376431.1 hypothetical protein [Rhodococcus sp. B50]
MSRNSIAVAMAGRHPELAGIGQFPGEGGQVGFEIGWPEVERDTVWVGRLLELWGVGRGQNALVTARNAEGPWFGPVAAALRDAGVIYSAAEPYGWDAKRSRALLAMLPITAVIGIEGEHAEGLLADEHGAELLRAVPVIWARTDAVGPLCAAGLNPAELVRFGPALAVECPQRAGLHLDPSEWRITPSLRLSVVGERKYQVEDLDVGVTGTVDDTPCACGLPGARVHLD